MLDEQISVLVREIAADDIADLNALYMRSLNENRAGFIQPSSHASWDGLKGFCDDLQLNAGCMLGLFYRDRLIGCGGLRRETEKENAVELCKLHLAAEYQGQGLGRYMLARLIEKAQILSYQNIFLHVTVTQTAAINLYRTTGFIETHRAVYHAVDGSTYDTIYMWRKLVPDG
jgi:ribosomal protein S18 acetylase RimI-like enzyme